MLSLSAAPRPGRAPSPWAGRHSPVSVPRLWTAAAFVACAGFAGGVALFSTNDLHRLWGLIAACAYAAAAVAVVAWRSRGIDLALLLSASGALVTPLLLNAASGRGQPEVAVIAQSAQRLVHHQSPYLDAASLATMHDPNAYNPYLPVMSLFGIPRALFGSHVITDSRVWFWMVRHSTLRKSSARSARAGTCRFPARATPWPCLTGMPTVVCFLYGYR